MKTYQSTTEGQWIELKGVQLTKEQRELMRSRNEADKEAQEELAQFVKTQREGEVESNKVAELTSFYNSIKPIDSNFQLISMDLSEKEEGRFVGILNYRSNGEHKQIRF